MTTLIGQSLGRYHILEQLGEGGMAIVYKAFDTRLETNVAIKVIRTERFAPEIAGGALKRFEREAKALAQLNHPNIVKVIDYGEHENKPYLVMPFLEGGTLKELLQARGSYPWQEVVKLMLPIARALEYAHRRNMIHRDVKPSNILITDSGEPLLSDFGVAKIIDDESTIDLTGTSATVGTPEYMAPEQVISKTVDHRADIYAYGVVLYEMITGRKPFTADTPMAVLFKHASEPLPRPKLLVPGLPERVEQVLIKTLAKKPEDRYLQMGDLAMALEGLLAGPVPQPVPIKKAYDKERIPNKIVETQKPAKRKTEAPSTPSNRKSLWIGAGIVGLLVLIGGGIFLGWTMGRQPAGGVVSPSSTAPVYQPTSTQQPRQSDTLIQVPVLLPTRTRPADKIPVLLPTGTRPGSKVPVLLPTRTSSSGTVTQIRWSIGLGTGADPAQVAIEQSVVDDFNNTHKDIHLSLEIIPNASARDTLAAQIAANTAPDVIGPVGWIGSNAFGDVWLDIGPYLDATNYDTSKFESALSQMYQTDSGTVSLPFAVYPSAIYYNTKLFQEAGVNPPPAKYGDIYKFSNGSKYAWNWDILARVARMMTIDSNGRNATESGFNRNSIIQYGFSFAWEGHPNYWATFQSNGGQILVPGGSAGSYKARIPEHWKTAWQWVYDGIWGAQPFIPNGTVAGSANFDSGNVFASGKVAMVDMPSWYLCCLTDLTKAGGRFDFAAMPVGRDAEVAGRVDVDSFRIWKGTQHPAEAFTVLTYLIDTGIQKLIVGTSTQAPAYGAIPSQIALRGPWLSAQKANFPFVKNWDVLLAGLNYPDIPSAEGYMPNINEAWSRIQTFGDMLVNNAGVNLAGEEAKLLTDLNIIFNK